MVKFSASSSTSCSLSRCIPASPPSLDTDRPLLLLLPSSPAGERSTQPSLLPSHPSSFFSPAAEQVEPLWRYRASSACYRWWWQTRLWVFPYSRFWVNHFIRNKWFMWKCEFKKKFEDFFLCALSCGRASGPGAQKGEGWAALCSEEKNSCWKEKPCSFPLGIWFRWWISICWGPGDSVQLKPVGVDVWEEALKLPPDVLRGKLNEPSLPAKPEISKSFSISTFLWWPLF